MDKDLVNQPLSIDAKRCCQRFFEESLKIVVYESDGLTIHENKNHKGLSLQQQTAFKEFTLPVGQRVKKLYGRKNEDHMVYNINTWKLELGTNI